MLEIKFKNEEKQEITYFRKITEHVVAVGLDNENTNGFELYVNGELSSDWSDYTTIYRKDEGITYFSNDGSIYVEPTKIEYIFVLFNGTVDSEHVIPESVKVTTNFGTVTITEENNWTGEVVVPVSQEVEIINASEVEGWEMLIEKKSINYNSDAPTWQEKIEAQTLYTALMTDTLIEE